MADPAAAFPTAIWVAAMRAMDLKGDHPPMIGENIGAGPDLAADVLAGGRGYEMLREFAAITNRTDAETSYGLVTRTRFLDARLMAAHAAGVRQFVVLAAGLDARAWRLPLGGDASVLYELDVPEALAYKQARIDAGALAMYDGPACRRIAVAADLSQASWADALVAAGFDAALPSFFLCEGLLMYLPRDGSAERLLEGVAGLMAPSSSLCGDILAGVLSAHANSTVQSMLAKWGTKWSWDLADKSKLGPLLDSAGLTLVECHLAKTLQQADNQLRKALEATQLDPDGGAVDERLAQAGAESMWTSSTM